MSLELDDVDLLYIPFRSATDSMPLVSGTPPAIIASGDVLTVAANIASRNSCLIILTQTKTK